MEETISCFCNNCSGELGQFRNAWNVIGNNYYSPVYPIVSFGNGFLGTGDIRASKLGQLETCFLQNLNCKTCHVFLGIRCDSAPQGHILKKNQFLLRLSEITTLVADTKQKAQISVKSSFILESAEIAGAKKSKSRAPSLGPSRSRSTSVQVPPPQQPSTFKHSAAAMPPPPIPSPQEDVLPVDVPSAFQVWAEKEIKDQRKDIDRISGTVDRIEKTMDDIKGFMEEMRGQRVSDNSAATEKMDELEKKVTSTATLVADSVIAPMVKTTNAEMGRLTKIVEASGQKAFDDVESLKGKLTMVSGKMWEIEHSLSRQSQESAEWLRSEMGVLKTKISVLEASTKKMRADANNAELARIRNERALHNNISTEFQKPAGSAKTPAVNTLQNGMHQAAPPQPLRMNDPSHDSPYGRQRQDFMSEIPENHPIPTQTVPLQQALELAGMVNRGSNAPSPQSKRIEVPIQQALELAGMLDKTGSVPVSPYTNSFGQRTHSLGLNLKPKDARPPSRREPTSVQRELTPFQMEAHKIQPIATPRKERPEPILPVTFTKSIIRVEISPMRTDQFPPIKPFGESEPRTLSSPSPDLSDSSDTSSIPPMAKRKRTHPPSSQTKEGVLSPPKESGAKRRKVSESHGAGNAITSRLESPEPDFIDISSSDEDESPDLSGQVAMNEFPQGQTTKPRLEQSTQDILSVLNDVSKQPFKSSFGPNAPIIAPRSHPNVHSRSQNPPAKTAPRVSRPTPQMATSDSLYDQSPILNSRTRQLQQKTLTSQPPSRDWSESSLPRPNGDKGSLSSQQTSATADYHESSIERELPDGPAKGPSVERFRNQLQDFAAPRPPSSGLKSRRALEDATRNDSVFESIERDEEVAYNNAPAQAQGQLHVHFQDHGKGKEKLPPLATAEQISNPYKCGVCNRRFSKPASLKNHKHQSAACRADSSRDEVPSTFICSGCENIYPSLVAFNKHQCPSYTQNPNANTDAWINTARRAVEEDAKRRVLEERDRIARGVMEREMERERIAGRRR